MPDRATLYICGIEDRQYKDEKINCKSVLVMMLILSIGSKRLSKLKTT